MSDTAFFEGLSMVGWMGVGVWVLFIISMITKGKWYTKYDERFPKINAFDEYLYMGWHYVVFLVVRFFVIVLVIWVVTKIMFIL